MASGCSVRRLTPEVAAKYEIFWFQVCGNLQGGASERICVGDEVYLWSLISS